MEVFSGFQIFNACYFLSVATNTHSTGRWVVWRSTPLPRTRRPALLTVYTTDGRTLVLYS